MAPLRPGVPFRVCFSLVLGGLLGSLSAAQGPGNVRLERKISGAVGGFTGVLDDTDRFGASLAFLGDQDGDGVGDIAVGAYSDDDGGPDRGAVWILFLHADATVKSHQKISSTEGGFVGPLDDRDEFGRSVVSLGDLDGDGSGDIAVGAGFDDDGGNNKGALWILFLHDDGSVKAEQKISETQGGFTATLLDQDYFGRSSTRLGDLDGDGVVDLAVGAPFADEAIPIDVGAVWILFLNTDGTVKAQQKIGRGAGGFSGTLNFFDTFGSGVYGLGDRDGDGVPDLAVGAMGDDDGDVDYGGVYLLDLNPDGTVKAQQKISALEGGFTGELSGGDLFGFSITSPGDLDADGIDDLAVGAKGDDDGGTDRGAIWMLLLNEDGTVKAHQKISSSSGGLDGPIGDGDALSRSLTAIGDFDGDGLGDLAAGAPYDDDAANNAGAFWFFGIDGVAEAAADPYGCDVNPTLSLPVLNGPPSVGSTLVLGIDNPLGTQAVGSLPLLFLSGKPDPAFPCGSLLPSFGMVGAGAPGELLIDLSPANFLGEPMVGAPWLGAGNPAPIAFDIPDTAALYGTTVYAQGLLFDPTVSSGVKFGLTEAVQLRVGP